MLQLVISSVRHNLGRYLATLIAIMTGVGFYTAAGVVSDGVISSLEGNVDAEYGNVDVAVTPDEMQLPTRTAADLEALKVPQATVDQLLALPGVDGGAGILTGSVAFLGRDGTPFATSAVGRLWVTDEDLNPISVAAGDAPDSAGRDRRGPRHRRRPRPPRRGRPDVAHPGREGEGDPRRDHRVRRLRCPRQRRHGLHHRGRRLRLAQLRPVRVRVLLPPRVRRPR